MSIIEGTRLSKGAASLSPSHDPYHDPLIALARQILQRYREHIAHHQSDIAIYSRFVDYELTAYVIT